MHLPLDVFAFKWPVSVAMLVASALGAIVGGVQNPVRHLVEGTFGYLDTIHDCDGHDVHDWLSRFGSPAWFDGGSDKEVQ